MNSSRGKAVEAALEYANWVAKYKKITEDGQEKVLDGFAAIPEVRKMLEWQLASDNRTVEAFSVIGQYIGLLYLIDKEWLSATAAQLFYLGGIEELPPVIEGWSAWNTFLVWGNPHIVFYRMFKAQYAYTVEQAKSIKITESSRTQPMYRLGEHLVLYYGRGQLGFDDDEGLLRSFLVNSNSDIRRYAIRFVGQSLEGNEKVPGEVVNRFQTLWDTYWHKVGKKDAEETSDADLFGTWFSSGKFPKEWALKRLEEYIEIIPLPESSSSILEQLAKVTHYNIERAICILDQIVRADHEGWRIRGWQEPIMQILKIGVRNKDETSHAIATDLINYLGRRGYTDFGTQLL